MTIHLLDNTLKLNIYFEETDRDFEDDICLSFFEDSVEEERIFKVEETNIFITPDQACLIVLALERALKEYRQTNQEP